MFHGRTPRFVSAAEITRNFGMWQDRAAQGPLVVTHHGRPRVVLLAIDDYEALSDHEGDAVLSEPVESARLSTVLAQVGTAFIAFDETLAIVRVNAMAVALLALPEELLVGRAVGEALPAADGLLDGQLREVLRTGEEAALDLPIGSHGERLLRMRLFPYPGGVAATFRNIAGQRDAGLGRQEQLAQARARIVHGAVAAARLGPRGTFAHVEPAFGALAGFAPDRLLGVRLTDLLAIGDRMAAGEAVEAVLTGHGAQAFDATLLANTTADRPVRIALAELREGFAIAGATVLVTVRG